MQWSYLDLWRVTQHERFPTRFSYLKGSSMELLTLEPTSKIDFSCSTTTAHLKKGFRGNITSLSSCGIQYRILAVLNAKGPLFIGWGLKWASSKNIPGRRLDGGHGPSGRTTVQQDFSKISRGNLSCLRASSGRDDTSFGRSQVHCK
jgi:hypothetical protein